MVFVTRSDREILESQEQKISALKAPLRFPVIVVTGRDVFEDSTAERELDPLWIEIGRFVMCQIAQAIERTVPPAELIRAKQEALDASTAKSNFLAQVSHEIRTATQLRFWDSHLLLSRRTRYEPEELVEGHS